MYIIKNAYINIIRSKGRNLLIGLIITVITIGSCIALSIHKSGDALIETYKSNNPLAVTFNLEPGSFKNRDSQSLITPLTEDDIIEYAESDLVSDYYYTSEVSLSSDIEPINYDEMFEKPENEENDRPEGDDKKPTMDMGDFRLTGYSDPAYITEFIDGSKKITAGEMFTKDTTEQVVVISSELAEENDLEVGDEVTFYLTNDEETTFTFEIIGIYDDESEISTNDFMDFNANNSRNQIYTTFASVDAINDENSEATTFKGIEAKIYLKSNDSLEKFEDEVREKGLSEDYTVTTNEDEVLQTLQPISNLSNFSITFLIVILIIGGIVLALLNLINIRDRKYEIGVLRAIGMSKKKVTLQLVCETFIVAIISLIIGAGIGILLSQPVSNKMLEHEISSYQEQSQNISNNFGNQGFERKAFTNQRQTNNEFVDEFAINIDAVTIFELFLVELFLTIISAVVAVAVINKYEPNKILQNRN